MMRGNVLLTRPAPSWWPPGRRAARRAPLNRPYAALLTVVFRPKEGREPAPAPTSDGRGICSWRLCRSRRSQHFGNNSEAAQQMGRRSGAACGVARAASWREPHARGAESRRRPRLPGRAQRGAAFALPWPTPQPATSDREGAMQLPHAAGERALLESGKASREEAWGAAGILRASRAPRKVSAANTSSAIKGIPAARRQQPCVWRRHSAHVQRCTPCAARPATANGKTVGPPVAAPLGTDRRSRRSSGGLGAVARVASQGEQSAVWWRRNVPESSGPCPSLAWRVPLRRTSGAETPCTRSGAGCCARRWSLRGKVVA